ncbi:copia protein [Tanacetum coccineum]
MPCVASVRPSGVIFEDRISNEKVNTVIVNGVNTAMQTAVSTVRGTGVTIVKALAGCVWRPKMTDLNNEHHQQALKNQGIFDIGCSRHMTGNKDFLTDYQELDGGFVAFGGSARGEGKATQASCKAKLIELISQPLQMLLWTYLALILTEFKNREMNEFCGLKGIKREFSIARTPQQNGVAERKNKTLIEAARTMLADSLLPTVFWAEVVNTACYVLNRVLVTKPHNKTPYELIIDRTTKNRFMRPLDVCSLLYLTANRPDIMFSVCLCARLQEDPKTSHLEAVKRIFRYIKGTTHLGLWYPKGTRIETTVYAYSDHVGDYVDRKSISGVCTFMGCYLTLWFSKKITALAISTTEAEYVFAGKACQQALWMKQALVDYDIKLDDIPVFCENKGSIDLNKNPVLHSRTKHIEIRHHLLRDNVQNRNISIEMVSSEDNIADILTKPLKREPFNFLRLGLGLMEPKA